MIDKIEECLIKNKQIIEEAINLDNKKMEAEFKFDDLINVIKRIKQKKYGVNKNEKSKTFITIYNGNPKITLELSIVSLIANSNIIFMIHDDFLAVNSALISIFNKINKENNLFNLVKLYNNILKQDISKTEEIADKIIYIGDKFDYQNIKRHTNLPIIYNGFGSVIVYTDDKIAFKTELFKIKEYAFKNDIIIDFYDEDLEKSIGFINYDVPNDVSVIFSNDTEKIQKFKNEVHSKKILVNEDPFINYELDFDINDLM